MKAFRLVTEADPAAERVILAQRAKKLTRRLLPAEVADEAVKAGIINAQDAQMLKQALATRLEAIEVDVFTPDQFYAELNKNSGVKPSEAPIKIADSALATCIP